jgi:spore germination protein KA
MNIIVALIRRILRAIGKKRPAPRPSPAGPSVDIPSDMDGREQALRRLFHESSDIVIGRIRTNRGEALVVYVDGLIDMDLADRDIVRPLKAEDFDGDVPKALRVTASTKVSDLNALAGQVLMGNVAVLYEEMDQAVAVDLKHWSQRAVEPPDTEAVIRGPKEGFTESIRTNTSLLRRKIRSPQLVFESLSFGRQTNTPVAVAYVEGLVNYDVLQELKTRLARIDTDAILESGYLEEYIADSPLSIVPSSGMTQKPDVVAAKLLEGRVAVFCDGTPHVLTVPHLFAENLQSSEDYYIRPVMASALRFVRLVALFFSVLLPGLYVAAVNYDQEMIPTVFLVTLAAAREAIPLPTSVELFFMMLMFELLRESGTRLPRAIGSAISIVGALIIGDSAVKAGIVGAPAVIVIALTAVSSFIIPALTEFMTVYRYLFWLLGSMLGIIGISAGMMVMLTHVVSTHSFGIPVLSSFTREELKDTFVREPLRNLMFRPQSVGSDNRRRHKSP